MANENEEIVEITKEELDEQHSVRLEKLEGLKAAGKDPYIITKYPVSIYNSEIRERFEELENQDVAIAGRIMSWRDMG